MPRTLVPCSNLCYLLFHWISTLINILFNNLTIQSHCRSQIVLETSFESVTTLAFTTVTFITIFLVDEVTYLWSCWFCFSRASIAVNCLDRLHQTKKRGLVPCSLYLNRIVSKVSLSYYVVPTFWESVIRRGCCIKVAWVRVFTR